jgi:Uma2 family endonuclease
MLESIRQRLTSAAYHTLPESPQRRELIDGEIVVNPLLYSHQKVLGTIFLSLSQALQGRGELAFAPVGLHLEEGFDLESDLFWVSPQNTACSLGADARYFYGAPDLIIEVLSPTTAYRDTGIKYDLYEKHGVAEYWVIDPTGQQVLVYYREQNRFQRQGSFLSGQPFESAVLKLRIDTAPFFPPPPSGNG